MEGASSPATRSFLNSSNNKVNQSAHALRGALPKTEGATAMGSASSCKNGLESAWGRRRSGNGDGAHSAGRLLVRRLGQHHLEHAVLGRGLDVLLQVHVLHAKQVHATKRHAARSTLACHLHRTAPLFDASCAHRRQRERAREGHGRAGRRHGRRGGGALLLGRRRLTAAGARRRGLLARNGEQVPGRVYRDLRTLTHTFGRIRTR